MIKQRNLHVRCTTNLSLEFYTAWVGNTALTQTEIQPLRSFNHCVALFKEQRMQCLKSGLQL